LLTVKRIPKKKDEEEEEEEKEKRERAKRGKIAGFSWRSRIRMQREIAKVLNVAIPSFVTLTYPKDFPNMAEVFKRDFDSFIKRLARKFPNVAGIWKLEPQKRGAPHFHLLVWGADIAELREFVPEAWYEVVGSCDPNHLAWHKGELGNEHCVRAVESLSHARAYASKYMGKKVDFTCTDWGRWWGVFFRGRLPNGEKKGNDISDKKAIEIIRYMRKFLEHVTKKKIRRSFSSLTIICNVDFWMSRLL
jgi:hypothetical protein